MKPWLYIAGATALLAAIGGAYAYGRGDGRAIERHKQAAIEAAVRVEREKREQLVDQLGAGAARLETTRQQNVREIYRESHRVTERPVYRNVCVDADGMHLLDAAAGVANGEDTGGLAAAPGEGAGTAPQR